ncbi:MFS transporter [Myceligenerans xiligouense]|uniref:Putative MFS family arabinose efflux permease n=1 Tax=Myceligenerans xiligouense TaxID=253184 RepID=A0A3N4Z1D8_9MICO|nr:MFS transporter [Myceligenerans xiligouense]RPF19878.1 putative MFS family arabinose efflux permease [Myceligenerans xiligouense]
MTKFVEAVFPERMGRSFRWLVGSSWVSNIGDGIAMAAGPLLVASQTGSPFLVALAALLNKLPWLLFGLWAGAIADRVDRRRLVIVADALRVLVIAALGAFIVTGAVNITLVLAVMLALGIAEVFADTTSQTLMPMLVDKKDLAIGHARLQAGFLTANQLAGPPLGALLFAAGMVWPFLVQAVAVGLAIVLVAQVVTPRGPVRGDISTHVRQDIADGLRWVWRTPAVRTLMLTILTFNITYAAPMGVLVLYTTEHLGMSQLEFGLLTTAMALGGLLSTAAFDKLQRRFSFALIMRVVLSCEVLWHLVLAINTTEWGAFAAMFAFGAYSFVWGAISNAVRQRATPIELQGRVGSLNMVSVFGGILIGNALGGVIAEQWGLTAPFWFGFVGAGITLALIWRALGHIAHAEAD